MECIIARTVKDSNRARFYVDFMGWKVPNDDVTGRATIEINGMGGIIIRNNGGPDADSQRPGGSPAGAPVKMRAATNA